MDPKPPATFTPPSRLVLIAIIGLPLICFLLSWIVYTYAINTTPIGKMHLDQKPSPYPDNRRGETVDTLHGQAVPDPYRWLEDEDEADVVKWMKGQNELTRAYLDSLASRPTLEKRLTELYDIDAIGVPQVHGGRYFWKEREKGQEKAVLYWREGKEGERKVLIDPNTLSEDGSTALGMWSPSRDGKLLAYSLKPNNADEATLYLMDVATGENLPGQEIEGAKYASPSWTPDSAGFYYTWLPEVPEEQIAERPGMATVRYHAVGSDPAGDPIIHEATGNPASFIGSWNSWDGATLFTSIMQGWGKNDLYYRSKDESEWQPLVVGTQQETDVEAWDGYFYYKTNIDAPRFRLLRAPATTPTQEHWEEIVPEREDAVIESWAVLGGKLVLQVLKNASSTLEVRELDGTLIREIDLPAIGNVYAIEGTPDDPTFYYGFGSFTIAPEIWAHDVVSATSTKWGEIVVPVDPKPYVVKQVWYKSKDGTSVSMFLVFRDNTFLNGQTPFLLYGYGGFQVNMTPNFISWLYPWLEAGGGFALPNLRGGGEYGEAWHEGGMLREKQNTFDDAIAAAEFLLRERYTSRDRLAVRGGSNGGLLVGALITQRPDLFRAAVCAVPLLDMVRYDQFGSGKTWVPEYGDPADKQDFEALFAYSPYHRVKNGEAYPATLFLSADSDDRVDPMHARKMAAALQDSNGGPFPMLLRVEENSGHGGGDKVSKSVDMTADWMSFLMQWLQLKPGKQKR